MKNLTGFCFAFALLLPCPCWSQEIVLESPNKVLKLTFSLESGEPHYALARFNRPVVEKSKLGFALKDAEPLQTNWKVASQQRNSVDETWIQPWGEKKHIRDHHNELQVHLVETTEKPREMILVFRAFDDGIGFRYELPEQEHLKDLEIMDELTEFKLAGDHRTWWIPAFIENRYETLYQSSPVSELDKVHTPVTFETANGLYLSIHEAALTDYSSMTLAKTAGTSLEAELIPWSDGVKVKGSAPMKTPWRTIQVADRPGGLLTSYLILNLNEPNKLEDVSWIKPAKYVGIWWEMHLGTATWGSGPKHGATTENTKKYMDFAAENGFAGVLVEGWNVGWDGNWMEDGNRFEFTTPYDDFDIEELAEYGKKKNVRIIGHHETSGAVENYEKHMDEAYEFARKHGINAIKTGYVNFGDGILRTDENDKKQGEWHHGQYMVRHYRKAVETAAKYGIMLCAHEPIKDTGIRRTYPNMLTREGARGQEYSAWSADGGNTPEHTTILAFTRMLSGPMDFTPGTFDLLFEEERPENRINTTLAKQLALYVVIYSPLQMASDLPENYEANPAPFQFIRDVPVDWNDTQVLDARIGDYVTIVRQDRNSQDWYLGSITDEEGRLLEAPLTFLEPDVKYVATIYRDGDQADWVENPLDVHIEEVIVDHAMTLPLRLAPGGGQAIRFRPATHEEAARLAMVREKK